VPPAAAPSSGPLDVVLHIGTGKTGTSSIQYFMRRNRARLGQLGLLYPKAPGQTRHARLGLFIQPDEALAGRPAWRRQGASSPAAFRRRFRRRLLREIDQSGLSRVLFSDEALYGSSEQALRQLRHFTDEIAGSLRVVVYLRRQDDHLVSQYQQLVKVGETRRLVERAQAEPAKFYDYDARLQMWARLLEPTALAVRTFERESFVDGSLYQDFLQAAGVDGRADELQHVESRNESLDAESVELLRLLNVLRSENPDAATLVSVDRALVRRLAATSTGPTLTMPTPSLDEFMGRWEDSNRRVARGFLGDASGELFRAPRKTRNTITEQRLDPDRLDHFLDLLQLPEQTHAPLRELVEREAKVS
jgi:hypothetical protein